MSRKFGLLNISHPQATLNSRLLPKMSLYRGNIGTFRLGHSPPASIEQYRGNVDLSEVVILDPWEPSQDSEDGPAHPNIIYEEPNDKASSLDKNVSDEGQKKDAFYQSKEDTAHMLLRSTYQGIERKDSGPEQVGLGYRVLPENAIRRLKRFLLPQRSFLATDLLDHLPSGIKERASRDPLCDLRLAESPADVALVLLPYRSPLFTLLCSHLP
nr:hypothetical protein [Tanacetum cinerariifolium]